MQIPRLEDLGDLSGKRVLVRSDLNVPMQNGEIDDDYRIRQSLPTWQWLVDQGATVFACSHLGRPEGFDPAFSMGPVRSRAQELLPGVEVLENLRFNPGESDDDPTFVAELVAGFDAYVNDAFGSSHRAHGSIVGPPRTLPSAAGRLLAREVEVLGGLMENPARPSLAILGGAKVSDKIGVIDALSNKADTVIIGGGMAYTFLKALGHSIGDSLLQEDQLDYARMVLDSGKRVVLPTDFLIANAKGDLQTVGREIPDGWEGFDCGPQSRVMFAEEVLGSQTIFWNGPLGRFEDERFQGGTLAVAEAMAKTSGTSVIGGGDVVSAVNGFGLGGHMDWVSTGGGATLELIEQGDLPGLSALREAASRDR